MKQLLPLPRLIAVDLDGTLLKRDKRVDGRTLDALNACRNRGIYLAFVTGRTLEKSAEYLALLRPDAAVLSYGAHILINGQTVYRRYMSPAVANRLLQSVRCARYIRYQLDDGTVYTDWPKEPARTLDRSAPIRRRVGHLCAWEVPEAQALSAARSARASLSQLCASDWCHFSAYGCNKGRGLKQALSFLSLPEGCGVGFGDEDCDIGFFRVCGVGVAMQNADQRTKSAADYITESNENAGVAAFLENCILR